MAAGGLLFFLGVVIGSFSSQNIVVEPSPPAYDPPPVVREGEFPTPSIVLHFNQSVDHYRGSVTAPISIIEYSDFECPFCQRVHATHKQLLEDYNGKVNWVYRHFPLSFHPNAQITAEASECVAELGGNAAFWTFADIVFEDGALEDNLSNYASRSGVSVSQFKSCLESGRYRRLVATQMDQGSTSGITGTPGHLVCNNKTQKCFIVSGAQPIEKFRQAIDLLLE